MTSNKRPISPHLQVYRPQITSVTSILHRISGLALALGTLMLAGWLIAAASGPAAFDAAQGLLGSVIGRIVLFGFTAALFYHLCNGIRHLAWDAGYGFEIGTATKTGWFVIIAAAVLTVIAFAAGYALRG